MEKYEEEYLQMYEQFYSEQMEECQMLGRRKGRHIGSGERCEYQHRLKTGG